MSTKHSPACVDTSAGSREEPDIDCAAWGALEKVEADAMEDEAMVLAAEVAAENANS